MLNAQRCVQHCCQHRTSDSGIVNSFTCCSLAPLFARSLPCLIGSCLLLLLVVIKLANKPPTLHILALGLSLCVLCSCSLTTIHRLSCLLAFLLCSPLLSSLSPEQSCQELESTVKDTSAHNTIRASQTWCTNAAEWVADKTWNQVYGRHACYCTSTTGNRFHSLATSVLQHC